MKELPHVARLHREESFRLSDEAGLKAAASRIARWPGIDFQLIHFAVPAESRSDAKVDRRLQH